MADDEIDFDDLDLGDLEGTPDDTNMDLEDIDLDENAPAESSDDFGDLDDLGDLDLGDTSVDDDGASDDLFDDLDEKAEGENKKKKKKTSLLAGRWQYPVFVAAITLGVLNFFVFPASETKNNQMQKYNRLAHIQNEKGNWALAKQYLDQVFNIEKNQPLATKQMIADVSFALAEENRKDKELNKDSKKNPLQSYSIAQSLYQAIKEVRDPETDKVVVNLKGNEDLRFYIDYQIARCLYYQNLLNEAQVAFEKLQDKIDENNRERLMEEKKGMVYTATDEIWTDMVSKKYPRGKNRYEILNYLGNITEKNKKLQESILWFKRYAPHVERGIEQLKVWQKIARGYFLDNDINSSIKWYDRIANEYAKKDEAKDALYALADLLRKNKRYAEARDKLKYSMTGKINEEHNAKALFLIGQCYLDEGDLKNASKIFKGTLATEIKYQDKPVGTAGALKEAEILYRKGQFEKSYNQYLHTVETRKFVFENPFVPQKEIVENLQSMAVKSFQKKQYSNTEKIYEFMLKNFKPDRGFILNKLAEAIVAQEPKQGIKRLVDAGITYQRIPAEAKGSKLEKAACEKAADLFFRAADWAKAEKAYGNYLDKYPGDPQEAKMSYLRGMSLKMLKQFNENFNDENKTLKGGAEYYFKETVRKHANSLFAYRSRYELGLLYAQRDNWQGARDAFTKIINDDLFTPRSRVWRDSLFELGRVEHFMNKPIPAVKHLLEAIERYPNDKRVFASRVYLGYSYFNLKKYADAREQLRQVINVPRTNNLDKDLQRYATLTIADTYVREKDFAQALAEYKSAYSKYQRSPDAPWINFQIARCLEHLKQPEQALVEYNKTQWLYSRSKKNNYQELPDNLRKKYWTDQVDWTKNSKEWFDAQKNKNNTFFETL